MFAFLQQIAAAPTSKSILLRSTVRLPLSYRLIYDQKMGSRLADISKDIVTARKQLKVEQPPPQPEVHIMGEIVGGTGFGGSDVSICCKWSIECGDKWEWLQGSRSGQTHTTAPEPGETGSDLAVWNHPIDLHYVASSIVVSSSYSPPLNNVSSSCMTNQNIRCYRSMDA